MQDMAHYTPDAALAFALLDPVTTSPPLPSAAKRSDAASPRPWRTNQYATIMDASGEAIFTPRIPSNGGTMRDNAALVVEAVNGYADALAHAEECSRAAAAERAARARAVEEAQREANLRADRLREEVDKLNDVAVNLMRSRDAALAEAERLRNALVMFAEEWDNYAAEEGIRAPAWSSLFRSFARSCREAAGEGEP